jgi:hypothetical protein
VTTATVKNDTQSVAELTRAVFGEALSIDQVLARLELVDLPVSGSQTATTEWSGPELNSTSSCVMRLDSFAWR